MSLDDIASVVALTASLISIAGVVYVAGVKTARIDVKLEVLWDAYRRSGISAATAAGAGTINSPFRLSDTGREYINGIYGELHEFYHRCGRSTLPRWVLCAWCSRIA